MSQAITVFLNLPLDRSKLKSIAVIGPNANRAHLGGYTDPNPPTNVSILDGVKAKLGSSVKVNYAEGVKITKEGGNWFGDTDTLNDAMKRVVEPGTFQVMVGGNSRDLMTGTFEVLTK